MRTIEASLKSFVHVLMDSFSPFSLEFESTSLHSCNRELCTRANAMAGVVQPSCHSCHKLYFPFTHVDVFLTTSAILHFFYRTPIKNLIHLLFNHSQLPSSPPTKLPLLPPSSPWRGCSRTSFGRRSCCNGFVEILPIVSLKFRCPPVTNVCNRGESLTSVLTFNHYQHLIIVFLHLMFLGEFVGTRICTS